MRAPVRKSDKHAPVAQATVSRAPWPLLALALVLGFESAGCTREPKPASTAADTPSTAATTEWWGQDTTQLVMDATKFTNSATISNEWFPLKPGLRMTFEGTAFDDAGVQVPRKMQINVTDLTKEVGGVRSLVCWDLDWTEGMLVEAELACFAQDNDGNVWVMGEYPEEYDDGNGVVTANPAWFHGFENARAGMLVPSKAVVGGPTFSQGWGPEVGYSDRGKVDSVGVSTCVPLDCYSDLMVVAESSGDEVEVEQLKYYAKGVGNVRAHWRGKNDKEQQTLLLTKIEMLDAKGIAEVRKNALALDAKAIKNNPLYAQTAKIQGPSNP